ncbi:hypothetical protein IW261DRAFT_1606539 [Armillaria novae-zelandiae]|uniref:Protein kinase domain-containing protein n=1 Tax=Armillaria novae-zelandiae TaxID=153914 RepID=A0AA39PEQ0_9AGAR|nr:hypothetical protein IW261DRAFT_1606539 [Armillaria novae-zelandiae]
MPHNSSIDKWIQSAKFITTVGEMAPFPYIKGAAGCVVIILEAIEKAEKNDEDLRALADDIGTTMRIVKETIESHGISSATHFQAVCGDFQTYLENLLSNLDITQRNLNDKRYKRFLKALKARRIADTINDFKQRISNIKSDYIVRGITELQLEVPVMQDVLSTRITEAVETSQFCITSTVESRSDRIINEIRNLREIQREHMTKTCTRVQDRYGYYKGMFRDLAPGDIYLIKMDPHDRQHGYCTVENSNTHKLIHIYKSRIGNEEEVMKQLDHDIDIFIRPRHPNIAQVFGVCRSPSLPAIIFHGSMQVPVDKYLDSQPVQDLIPVLTNLFRDIPSILAHLAEHYHNPEDHIDEHGTGIYVNEHGRLLLVNIIHPYVIMTTWYSYDRHIDPLQSYWNLHTPGLALIHLCDIWGGLPWMALLAAYDSICTCQIERYQVQPFHQQGQHYMPGSILTAHGQTLVGGIQDKSQLSEWDVWWRGPSYLSEDMAPFIFHLPSTDCGPIVIDPLVHPIQEFKGNTIPILHAGTVPHYLEICLHSHIAISSSWIAQASHLDTSLRSRGCIDNDGLYQIYGYFSVLIEPLDKHGKHFHLCDTFMVEDIHMLSLFISPPVVDYSSHKISVMPVLTWLYDGDLEISLDEAEQVFGFKLITSWVSWSSLCSSSLAAIPKLNVEHGYNLAKGGTDICEFFGWPVLELFDVPKSMECEEWMTSNTASKSLESQLIIISEGAQQTLCEDVLLAGSPWHDVEYVVMERIEEVDANNEATKMNITAAMQHNVYPRCSELLIVVITAIVTLLLALFVQIYLHQ